MSNIENRTIDCYHGVERLNGMIPMHDDGIRIESVSQLFWI